MGSPKEDSNYLISPIKEFKIKDNATTPFKDVNNNFLSFTPSINKAESPFDSN